MFAYTRRTSGLDGTGAETLPPVCEGLSPIARVMRWHSRLASEKPGAAPPPALGVWLSDGAVSVVTCVVTLPSLPVSGGVGGCGWGVVARQRTAIKAA